MDHVVGVFLEFIQLNTFPQARWHTLLWIYKAYKVILNQIYYYLEKINEINNNFHLFMFYFSFFFIFFLLCPIVSWKFINWKNVLHQIFFLISTENKICLSIFPRMVKLMKPNAMVISSQLWLLTEDKW